MSIIRFKTNVEKWLSENGYEVGIEVTTNFAYNRIDNQICFGVVNNEKVGKWFSEYMIKKGCNYAKDIPWPVLAFIHELGHFNTIDQFSEEELILFSFMKESKTKMKKKSSMFSYWSMPDEDAANTWAVHFLNEQKDKLIELCELLATEWENLVNSESELYVSEVM